MKEAGKDEFAMDNKSIPQVRTDLAVEARDMYVEKEKKQSNSKQNEIKGVTIKERKQEDINISYVEVDETGAEMIGKKPGTYVTIYADGVKRQDTASQEAAAKVVAKELEELINKNNIRYRERSYCRIRKLECNS